MKIATHPLPHSIKWSVVVVALFVCDFLFAFVVPAFAIHVLLGRDVLHGGACEHSFSAGNVPPICADVNCADRLSIPPLQSDDPDRVAMLISPQGVACAIEACS